MSFAEGDFSHKRGREGPMEEVDQFQRSRGRSPSPKRGRFGDERGRGPPVPAYWDESGRGRGRDRFGDERDGVRGRGWAGGRPRESSRERWERERGGPPGRMRRSPPGYHREPRRPMEYDRDRRGRSGGRHGQGGRGGGSQGRRGVDRAEELNARKFYHEHKHDEWFLERYHPERLNADVATRKENARKAAEVFAKQVESGELEAFSLLLTEWDSQDVLDMRARAALEEEETNAEDGEAKADVKETELEGAKETKETGEVEVSTTTAATETEVEGDNGEEEEGEVTDLDASMMSTASSSSSSGSAEWIKTPSYRQHPAHTVFVNLIPPQVSREQVLEVMGSLDGCEIVKSAFSPPSRKKALYRFAWVTYAEAEQCERVLQELKEPKIGDVTMEVQRNEPRYKPYKVLGRKLLQDARAVEHLLKNALVMVAQLDGLAGVAAANSVYALFAKEGGAVTSGGSDMEEEVATPALVQSADEVELTERAESRPVWAMDVCVQYLRQVHAFCMFCQSQFNDVDEVEARCGPQHLRFHATAEAEAEDDGSSGEAAGGEQEAGEADKAVAENEAKGGEETNQDKEWQSGFTRQVEQEVGRVVEVGKEKGKTHAAKGCPYVVEERLLGKAYCAQQMGKALSNFYKQEGEELFTCTVCSKHFLSLHFMTKHMKNRHVECQDVLRDAHMSDEELANEVAMNNYLADPGKVTSLPSAPRGATGSSSSSSSGSQYGGRGSAGGGGRGPRPRGVGNTPSPAAGGRRRSMVAYDDVAAAPSTTTTLQYR